MSTIADQKTYALAVKAFSQSISHIRTDPLAAGGPRYRFHHLNLLNYVYVTDYFIIQYALDEERHLIYLRKFILFQS